MRIVSILLAFSVVVAALVVLPDAALAGSTNDLLGKIKEPGKDLNTKLNEGAQNIVKFLRSLGLIIAAVMLIWAGVTFAARGGNPQALMDMKGRLIAAAVGLILVFGAEVIVNFFVKTTGFETELSQIGSGEKEN